MDKIYDESLDSLIALLQLDISFNLLTTLPDNLFHFNTQLEEIILANNKIEEISSQMMLNQNHLRYIKLSGNAISDAAFLDRLSPSVNRFTLYVDLSSNRLKSLNLSSLLHFRYINLADNNWSCNWLVANLVQKLPNSVNFARPWTVINNLSENTTNIEGIDCIEGGTNRSIILLDVSGVPQPKSDNCDCVVSKNRTTTSCYIILEHFL